MILINEDLGFVGKKVDTVASRNSGHINSGFSHYSG